MTRLHYWLAATVLVAGVGPVIGQQPTFRSGVDLVTVDLTVLGRDGEPIDNLGPEDFQLAVDGHPRRVVSAQFVSQAAARTRAGSAAAAHFTSNQDADSGRIVVVGVDEAHIRRLEGRQALQAAGAFIDVLDPADHVSVVGLTRPGTLAFTRDRVALKRRLATLVGQTDPVFLQFNMGLSEALEIADGSRTRLADAVLRECGRALTEYVSLARAAEDGGAGRDGCPEQIEQESRAIAQHAHTQARISLSAIESMVRALEKIDGPKTLVLLSEGLIADPRRVDLQQLAAAAQAARVTIYVLQLEMPTFEAAQDRVSPTFTRDLQVRGDGLSRVAGAARGAVFRLVGNDQRPFERIARELSGYYLLAFEASDADRDGRTHRIHVSLARGGGELRSRTAFTLPSAAPSSRSRDERLVALLRSTSQATELPLRVATYTYVEPQSPKLRVVVSAEAESATAASPVLLGFVLVDERGVIAASASREVDKGRFAFSSVVPPGPYTLRVAAIDPLGRQGSVERVFTAGLVEGDGLRVSDLILAPPPGRASDPLEPIIDQVKGPTVVAYLELHTTDGQPLADARVNVGVAASDAGAPLSSVAAEVVRHGTWATVRALVPTAWLLPGSYVMRADVIASNGAVSRVARPFTIPAR
jgi:VWFA-related protein